MDSYQLKTLRQSVFVTRTTKLHYRQNMKELILIILCSLALHVSASHWVSLLPREMGDSAFRLVYDTPEDATENLSVAYSSSKFKFIPLSHLASHAKELDLNVFILRLRIKLNIGPSSDFVHLLTLPSGLAIYVKDRESIVVDGVKTDNGQMYFDIGRDNLNRKWNLIEFHVANVGIALHFNNVQIHEKFSNEGGHTPTLINWDADVTFGGFQRFEMIMYEVSVNDKPDSINLYVP